MKRLTTRTSMDGKAKLIVADGTLSDKLIEQIAIQRLAEYEDAEEQGLLVRLPCKVGDTVYRVIRGKKGRGHIAPASVSGLHLGDTTRNRRYQKEYEYLVLRVDGGFCAHVNKKDIGKTVFLTREAAEKALEGE